MTGASAPPTAPSAGARPRRRRRLLDLGLGVLLLLVAEGTCRLNEGSSKYVDSASLGYALKPGYRSEGDRVNALGLRGPEVRPRLEVHPRILCMGGSTTLGHAVDDDETWPHALEQALHDKGFPRAEVLNGAVSGYGLEQIVVALEEQRLAQLQPDLVLVYEGWNHAALAGNPVVSKYRRRAATSEVKGPLHHSAFVRWLDKEIEDIRLDAQAEAIDRVAQRADIQAIMDRAFPPLCQRLAALAAERGVPVVMVRYPGLMQLVPPEDGSLDERYGKLLRHDRHQTLPFDELVEDAVAQWQGGVDVVVASATAAGLPVLDVATPLLASLPAAGRHEAWLDLFRDRMHPSAAGNAAIGRLIADLLVDGGLLPAE